MVGLKYGIAATTIALALSVAPAQAQSAVDWSGFYAGVFAGYGLDREGASSSSTGPLSLVVGGLDVDGTMSSDNTRISGAFGGLQAGYNVQYDRLVFGLEGNFGLGSFGKSNSFALSGELVDGADIYVADISESAKYNVDWFSGLVGRVGIAHENWLFSLKGGVVVANASIETSSYVFVDGPGVGIDVPGASSASKLLFGPTVGFGIETMVADNISLSAEYNYVHLPELSAPTGGIGGLGLGFGGGSAFTAGIHQLKAGINYHF